MTCSRSPALALALTAAAAAPAQFIDRQGSESYDLVASADGALDHASGGFDVLPIYAGNTFVEAGSTTNGPSAGSYLKAALIEVTEGYIYQGSSLQNAIFGPFGTQDPNGSGGASAQDAQRTSFRVSRTTPAKVTYKYFGFLQAFREGPSTLGVVSFTNSFSLTGPSGDTAFAESVAFSAGIDSTNPGILSGGVVRMVDLAPGIYSTRLLSVMQGDMIGVSTLTGDFGVNVYIEPQAVPEPASLAALGLGALVLLRRRKRA